MWALARRRSHTNKHARTQLLAENKVADILNNMYHQGISYTQIQGADGRMKEKMHSDQPFGKIGYNLLAKERCRELLALIAREFATENRVWGIRRVLEVDERPRRWQRYLSAPM